MPLQSDRGSVPRHGITVVTCLAFEARIARGDGITIVANPQRHGLRDAVRAALERTAAVVSFGVAGGLDPRLRPGDWVVASAVRTPTSHFHADERWMRRLRLALPRAVCADICGVETPVASASGKAALGRAGGGIAVDTESHVVAEEAARAGVPFAVARVVLDPVWRSLPPAALLPLNPNGTPDLAAVVRSVMGAPHQLHGLGLIAFDAWRAWKSLRRGRARLGALFAAPVFEPVTPPVPAIATDGETDVLSDDCTAVA